MTALLAMCLAADPGDLARPLDFHLLNVEQAARLQGTVVSVWFEVGKPTLAYPEHSFTTAGPDDQDDDVERVVYLKGERYDITQGDKLTVRGTLRLIRHREVTVNGVVVPAWSEIRIDQ